jgi:hypothetical protein
VRRGRLAGGVEVGRPLFRPWVFFEECTVGVGFDVLGHALDVWVQVELPARAADALVVVWRGVPAEHRRQALARVLGRD